MYVFVVQNYNILPRVYILSATKTDWKTGSCEGEAKESDKHLLVNKWRSICICLKTYIVLKGFRKLLSVNMFGELSGWASDDGGSSPLSKTTMVVV